jgi:hypothetical protein
LIPTRLARLLRRGHLGDLAGFEDSAGLQRGNVFRAVCRFLTTRNRGRGVVDRLGLTAPPPASASATATATSTTTATATATATGTVMQHSRAAYISATVRLASSTAAERVVSTTAMALRLSATANSELAASAAKV